MQLFTTLSPGIDGDKSAFKFTKKPIESSIAYGLIFLLQFKLLNGVEVLRGITPGDNAWYYMAATDCLNRFKTDFLWSPLFGFLGSLFLHISNDALFCATSERIAIVVTLSLLFLSVCRRLMPGWIALLAATWWTVNPQVFDAVNDVHLFGAIPLLMTWLILLRYPKSRYARGTALAISLVSSMLIRNEQILYTFLLAFLMLIDEFKRRIVERRFDRKALVQYALPMFVSVALIGTFYVRSTIHFPAMATAFQSKQALNFGQSYAYTYHDAYPDDWKGNPYLDYNKLEQRDFGGDNLSISQAVRKNPLAFFKHLGRNSKLIPAGIEVLLFDCRAGTRNPDYFGTKQNDDLATKLSALAVLIVCLGGLRMAREAKMTLYWYSDKKWGLLAIASVIVCSLFLMALQMPRPEYVFGLGAALIAIISICFWRMLRVSALDKAATYASFAIVAFILLSTKQTCVLNPDGIQLGEYYRFLKPFASTCFKSNINVVVPNHHVDLCAMLLGPDGLAGMQHWSDMSDITKNVTPDAATSLATLKSKGVRYVMLDEPSTKTNLFHAMSTTYGWHLVALQIKTDHALAMFARNID